MITLLITLLIILGFIISILIGMQLSLMTRDTDTLEKRVSAMEKRINDLEIERGVLLSRNYRDSA